MVLKMRESFSVCYQKNFPFSCRYFKYILIYFLISKDKSLLVFNNIQNHIVSKIKKDKDGFKRAASYHIRYTSFNFYAFPIPLKFKIIICFI